MNEEYEEGLESTSPDPMFHRSFEKEQEILESVKEECNKIIVGQEDIIDKMLICIIADGHMLLEGVPGIAKTLIAKVMARIIKSDFSRIQFTPDLMPSDILGTTVFNMKDSEFNFVKGPIFSNVVLIDEINRAPAKTQAALFEVMEEKQISFSGETFHLGEIFTVIATQNPVEQEGTYRLPEAQLDRFMMKINLTYPSLDDEKRILDRYKNNIGKVDLQVVTPLLSPDEIHTLRSSLENIKVEEHILNYIASIIHETRNNAHVYLGASPRASLFLLKGAKVVAMMSGRDYIIPDDVQYIARDVICHRIILSPDAEISGLTTQKVVDTIIQQIEVPR